MDVTRCIAAVAFATSNTLLRWCSHSMLSSCPKCRCR
jgi:hypothetical protein